MYQGELVTAQKSYGSFLADHIVLLANFGEKNIHYGKCSLKMSISIEKSDPLSDLSGSICPKNPSQPSAALWMLYHAQPFADFSGGHGVVAD